MAVELPAKVNLCNRKLRCMFTDSEIEMGKCQKLKNKKRRLYKNLIFFHLGLNFKQVLLFLNIHELFSSCILNI